MNRAEEAEQYFSRAVAIQEAELGPDDVSAGPNFRLGFRNTVRLLLSLCHTVHAIFQYMKSYFIPSSHYYHRMSFRNNYHRRTFDAGDPVLQLSSYSLCAVCEHPPSSDKMPCIHTVYSVVSNLLPTSIGYTKVLFI